MFRVCSNVCTVEKLIVTVEFCFGSRDKDVFGRVRGSVVRSWDY